MRNNILNLINFNSNPTSIIYLAYMDIGGDPQKYESFFTQITRSHINLVELIEACKVYMFNKYIITFLGDKHGNLIKAI